MKNTNRRLRTLNFSFRFLIFNFSFLILAACSSQKKLGKSFQYDVLNTPALQTAHVGISLFDTGTGKYVYSYQGDKYFVPASNTKIPTCYAAMKYLGDSLVGLRYEETDAGINFLPTGDPTFMHPDFKKQRVFDFLRGAKIINYSVDATPLNFSPWGDGWAWNDYESDYAVERSEMPIYGNLVRFVMRADSITVVPKLFYNSSIQYTNSVLKNGAEAWYRITRPLESNSFSAIYSNSAYLSKTKFSSQSVPFKTTTPSLTYTYITLLEDTLNKKFGTWSYTHIKPRLTSIIHSQSTDSLLKPMMHRSDNFFAEQSLLMVSNEILGVMNDAKIIDSLLKTDLNDLPQKPRWVDGSGLSRYNLFTPQSFVAILNKMKVEFGMDRIKEIFPTGGEGTLGSLYKSDSTFIYAKTGTLSGVVALSGFLYTQKGKLLIFSVLVNNYQGSATPVRKAVEAFIQRVRKEY